MAPTTPSIATRMAPPVNCATPVPPGVLAPVPVAGGGSVAFVTGVGNGGALDDDGVDVGVTGAAAGVEEGVGVVVGGWATTAEEVAGGAAAAGVLEGPEMATVWPGLKLEGRERPNWEAQVAGSSPWGVWRVRAGRVDWKRGDDREISSNVGGGGVWE